MWQCMRTCSTKAVSMAGTSMRTGLVTVVLVLLLQHGECALSNIEDAFDAITKNESLLAAFADHMNEWRQLDTQPNVPNFPCAIIKPSSPATSVHALTPGDIGVVAALGDSLTAGIGIKADTIFGLLLEWRGLSWSMGGDQSVAEGAVTLPNILKEYNPKLKGYSTGIISYFDAKEGRDKDKTNLNVAISGSVASDLPGQAKELVVRMKSNVDIDYENDWKLITLFIGGNDLCALCKDESTYSATNYADFIQETLDYLQANVPRAFVNVVLILDVSLLKNTNDGLICNILHRLECKCGAFPQDQDAEQVMMEAAVQYRNQLVELIASDRYNAGDGFTVVLQPFYINTLLPYAKGKPDMSYFAPDCFHYSAKGHADAAQALWNNMVEPAGRKKFSWYADESWECPTVDKPYLYTYRNSFSGTNGQGIAGQHNKFGDAPQTRGGGATVSSSTLTLVVVAAALVAAMSLGVAAFLVVRARLSSHRAEKKPLLSS